MGNIEKGKSADSANAGKKSGFQISKEPVVHGSPEEDVHKYEATIGEPPLASSEAPAFEDLGTLPSTYGTKSLFLVARDPQWLFCYWDIDWNEFPASRMTDRKVILKLYTAADSEEVYSAEVTPEARNWYISAGRGNATFYSELGFVNLAGNWEVIARSNNATTPSDGVSDQVADVFATVPYHLAFQKMIDMVGSARGEGESLMSVLARIQNEGRKLAFVLGQVPEWTDEQRRLLAALLGNDFNEMMGLGSAEIDRLLRKQLQERLSSESASGLFPPGMEIAGGASLFSGVEFGLSSWLASWQAAMEAGEVTSWLSSWLGGAEVGAFASWLASWPGAVESRAVSSWLASWPGVGAPSSALSSWLASWPGGAQSEVLSSWLASWPGAQGGAFWSSWLSSWSMAAGASESFGATWLSSWQAAAKSELFWSSWTSSWSGAVGAESSFWSSWVSSWSGAAGVSASFMSSWLSSWPKAAGGESSFWSSWMSSWTGGLGGASGAFSSGLGASWSAQPFGKPRDFFMHVNAEVIFYGGTHPDAKVWIDDKPVKLNPDGSFRHHFIFPDGTYEIPIVAESPDGVERRSATLRFERGTERRGAVGATAQPAFLSEPMGRR